MPVPDPSLYDNDAILKFSAYACWRTLSATDFFPPAILKVATFSLASQGRKARRITDVALFRAQLSAFLALCQVLEPSPDEIAFATDLEEQAIALGEEFDTGESQLVAVLVTRLLPRLVTGDKRAVIALAALDMPEAYGRLCCLEQVLCHLVEHGDWHALRNQICAESKADTAVRIAFKCHSEADQADVHGGLASYIANLRARTGNLLCD